MRPTPLHRLRPVLGLLDTVSTGLVGGVLTFFALAFLTSSVAVMTGAGVLVFAGLTAWLGTRFARRWLPQPPWQRRAPWLIAGTSLLVLGLPAWWFVFRPVASPEFVKLATPDTQYWSLPTGSRLAYVRTPATGPRRPWPVVELHGGPGAPGGFEATLLTRTLAGAGFDVYRYDQLGAGLSGRLRPVSGYTVARQVADLEAIRVALRAERLILIGGSWGATLAAHYLAAHPERVERAVMSGPGAIWTPAFTASGGASQGPERALIWRRASPRFAVAAALLRINPEAAQQFAGDAEMSRFFQDIVGGLVASDTARCRSADGVRGAATTTSRPRPIRGFGFYANMVTSQDLGRTPDPRPALRRSRVPVLVLRGSCERLRWEVAREYRDVLPGAALVNIPGAGHSLASTHAKLHADLIRAFLLGERLALPLWKGDQAPP